jgi:hypothetical protein
MALDLGATNILQGSKKFWGSGAAGKAKIHRVKDPPCQLPDSGA